MWGRRSTRAATAPNASSTPYSVTAGFGWTFAEKSVSDRAYPDQSHNRFDLQMPSEDSKPCFVATSNGMEFELHREITMSLLGFGHHHHP